MRKDVDNNLLVSVVVICYNQVSYIRECLDGILMQKTSFPFEVKVYDDASTDGTADILREYGKKYNNLELNLYTENNFAKGLAYYGEKQGYLTARGKYIATCEGDDYWTDPLKLQKQVDFLESHPNYSVTFHRFRIYQESCNKWEEDGLQDLFDRGEEWVKVTKETFLERWMTQYVTMMFRKGAYRQELINQYKLFRDSHLYYSLLKEGNGAILSINAGVYRRTGTGIYTHMQKINKLKSQIAVFYELWSINNDGDAKVMYERNTRYLLEQNDIPIKTRWLYTWRLFNANKNIKMLLLNLSKCIYKKK